jgi:hypothetical protein
LLKQYKDKEHEFKKWVQVRVNDEVRKKKVTEEDEDNFFSDMMRKINDFIVLRNNKSYVSIALIEMEFRVGNRVAQRLKLKAEKEILSNPAFLPLRSSLSSNLGFSVHEKNKKREGGREIA